MRSTSATNRQWRNQGFTLIEMLIIAPVVILSIGAFIALMVSLVGTVLISRDRGALTYDIQNSLDQIEQDVRISAKFQTTTGTLSAPQGSDDNTAAFTSSSALVLTTLTTDKSPLDGQRQLVYYANQPNPCGTKETYNKMLYTTVVYYIKGGSLWRRVIVPTYNTNATPDANTVCRTPWQRNSCTPGYTASPPCQTSDSEIMKNVSSMSIKYLSTPGSTADLGSSNAALASTVEVTINGQKMTGGKSITTSGVMRATKLNVSADATAPTTPSVIYAISAPNTVTFSWGNSANATSYVISYSINGGSATNTTVSSGTTSFDVSVVRGDTVTFKLAAQNDAGTSPNSVTTVTVPIWVDYSLQNSWADYLNSYATHGVTRTKSGLVVLKGLVRYGTTTNGTVIGNLPVGYRPAERMLYAVETSANVNGRIDVLPTGDVVIVNGSSSWIAMDNIRFMPSGTTWTGLGLQNSWTQYDATYPAPAFTKTGDGMVVLKGLVKGGANATTIGVLPTGYRPSERLLFADESGSATGRIDILPTGEVYASNVNTSWAGLDNIQFMPSGTSWTNLTLQNSWVYYGSPYAVPAYTKTADGMVDLKGLIKTGASGTVIANLPVGYRPSANLIFQVETNANVNGRIDVRSNGDIYASLTDPGWAGLDNISFRAEQ